MIDSGSAAPSPPRSASPRVVVVGTCASGKSSLAATLKAAGIQAMAVSQEHSGVRELWDRTSPTHVILLETDVETIRSRRGDPAWPVWLFEEQSARLASARAHATLVIDTRNLSKDEVVAVALSHVTSG